MTAQLDDLGLTELVASIDGVSALSGAVMLAGACQMACVQDRSSGEGVHR
jgi:hypothetical protein